MEERRRFKTLKLCILMFLIPVFVLLVTVKLSRYISLEHGLSKIHIDIDGIHRRYQIPIVSEDTCSYKSGYDGSVSFIIRSLDDYFRVETPSYGDMLNIESKTKLENGYDAIIVFNGFLKEAYYIHINCESCGPFQGDFEVSRNNEDIGTCRVYFIEHDKRVKFPTL